MKYDRLFTFGCSYTNFIWPSWADIIAHDLDIPYQNWGHSGQGNVAIMTHMLECDIRNKFTDKDLILVCWSSFHREDRVLTGGTWSNGGNIFNDSRYSGKILKRLWSEENDIVKNCTAIISANKMFDITFQSHIVDYEGIGFQEANVEYNFNEKYGYLLNAMPTKIVFDTTSNPKFNGTIEDHHPDIVCHLKHAKLIFKSLKMELKNETIKGYKGLHKRISSEILRSNTSLLRSWSDHESFFKKYNWENFKPHQDFEKSS